MSDEENNADQNFPDEDTMKILLATDIHLGCEHSTRRAKDNDSFVTFEEILQQAWQQDVDFILLGGDLFHDSKPTQKDTQRCIELLKKYTMGTGNIRIQVLSDPEIVFPYSSQKIVNFEDPHMNIAMPIFSIHGNHDNPSFQTTGSMDVIGASGFINYFGKWPDLTNIGVPPLLINKGKTYVSIYGMSYINNQRFSRLIRDKQFKLLKPVDIPEPFNILVLHQNRSQHTRNGFIPEDKLPAYLDFIFWGHEHECRVEPELIEDNTAIPPRRYYISQPGSSVVTSLCQGEAREKKIGILKVNKYNFKINPIKLETVRPFVFEDLHLQTVGFQLIPNMSYSEVVYNYINDYIKDILIPKAKEQLTGNPKQPKIPLIRLRVFYNNDTEVFDADRLYRTYLGKVANPRDIIIFRKEKEAMEDDEKKYILDEEDNAHINEDMKECLRPKNDIDWTRTIRSGIRNYFAREENTDNLTVLSLTGMNEALRSFVEANDDDAFKHLVDHQTKKVIDYLKKFDVTDEAAIMELLKVYREERSKAEKNGEEEKEITNLLRTEARKSGKKPKQSRSAAALDTSNSEVVNDVDNQEQPATRERGKGSRGSTITAKGSTRGKGKATAAKTALDESVSPFVPKINSIIKPAKLSASGFSLSQLRPKPGTQGLFVDDSDSD